MRRGRPVRDPRAARADPGWRITVVAKHAKQRELARAFGASDVVAPDEVFRGVRRSTGAFRLKPEMAKEFLLGGVDIAVDAVGSKDSIDTCCG